MGYVLTVILLGANMPTSVYGLYRTEFGFTPTIQTLIYGVYVAGLVPALLFFGPLSDALGRRTVLITALALSVVGTLVLAFADATVWLFVGRVAQGIAVGAASAAGSAALVEQEPKFDHRRAALVSTVTGALGGALGPLVSGAIAQYLPQPLRLPYLIFLVAFIPALIVLLLLPQIGNITRPKRFFQMPHVPAAIRETFWLSSLAVALSWGAVGLFQSVVPSWMTSLLNIDNLLLGGGAAALVMICSVVAQLGGSRMDPRTSVTVGLGILALGMIGLLVVDLVPSLALLGVITVVVGAGHGLAFCRRHEARQRRRPDPRPREPRRSSGRVLHRQLRGTGDPVDHRGYRHHDPGNADGHHRAVDHRDAAVPGGDGLQPSWGSRAR